MSLSSKFHELFTVVSQFSAKERQRLLDDPAGFGLATTKTDLSSFREEIQTYVESQGPFTETVEERATLSEEECQRQIELRRTIFDKLGITDEIDELCNIRPQKTDDKKGMKAQE